MPLLETKGAGSAQGFGLSLGSAERVYIEDVFSTQVYTGSGTSKTITNGIDLAGEGGLVWTKMRTSPVGNQHDHRLSDSEIGVNQVLSSNNTNPKTSSASFGITAFNSDGYTITNPSSNGGWNFANDTFVSWTFRKQPKFFDIVTYTGNGTAGRTVAHDLGSAPGCIIVKRTDSTGDWAVYHRGVNGGTNPQDYKILLNLTNAQALDNWWNNTLPTSSSFQLSSDPTVNQNGATYVAYLFAHDAGGFGLTGTDDVISCGSFTTDGSGNATVTLGYEPQWVLFKKSSSTGGWPMYDTMRGMTTKDVSGDAYLFANLSLDEGTDTVIYPTATGFGVQNQSASATHIYIAIRRGPMKVPTSGTSVYNAEAFTGTGATKAITTLSAPDMAWIRAYKDFTNSNTIQVYDRLRGNGVRLRTGLTNADNTNAAFLQFNNQMLATVGNDGETNGSGALNVAWTFKRAPGFFDEVCYTGTGSSNRDISHNLTVIPELYIVKRRSGSAGVYGDIYTEWFVGLSSQPTWDLNLLDSQAKQTGNNVWGDVAPTATTFRTGNYNFNNASGNTYVAYLFATCPGVSKVGSYTGNGSSQTINCGFTGGARLVLIKRTDSTGDWYVWDSSRGIVAGNDPHLSLNTTAAEVTTDDSVDTDSTGFVVNQVAATNVNVTSAAYIFLAIS